MVLSARKMSTFRGWTWPSPGKNIEDFVTKAKHHQAPLAYSWIGCQLDIGRTPAFLLSISNFNSEVNFGFLTKNFTGHGIWFFAKSQHGLFGAFSYFVFWAFSRGFWIRVSAVELKLNLFTQTSYRKHFTCTVVCVYEFSITSQELLFRTSFCLYLVPSNAKWPIKSQYRCFCKKIWKNKKNLMALNQHQTTT